VGKAKKEAQDKITAVRCFAPLMPATGGGNFK